MYPPKPKRSTELQLIKDNDGLRTELICLRRELTNKEGYAGRLEVLLRERMERIDELRDQNQQMKWKLDRCEEARRANEREFERLSAENRDLHMRAIAAEAALNETIRSQRPTGSVGPDILGGAGGAGANEKDPAELGRFGRFLSFVTNSYKR